MWPVILKVGLPSAIKDLWFYCPSTQYVALNCILEGRGQGNNCKQQEGFWVCVLHAAITHPYIATCPSLQGRVACCMVGRWEATGKAGQLAGWIWWVPRWHLAVVMPSIVHLEGPPNGLFKMVQISAGIAHRIILSSHKSLLSPAPIWKLSILGS